MLKPTRAQLEEQRKLCDELPMIRHRLFACGLLKTGHAIEVAVKAIGYERAEYIEAMCPINPEETDG